jgi:hypothetical protein
MGAGEDRAQCTGRARRRVAGRARPAAGGLGWVLAFGDARAPADRLTPAAPHPFHRSAVLDAPALVDVAPVRAAVIPLLVPRARIRDVMGPTLGELHAAVTA